MPDDFDSFLDELINDDEGPAPAAVAEKPAATDADFESFLDELTGAEPTPAAPAAAPTAKAPEPATMDDISGVLEMYGLTPDLPDRDALLTKAFEGMGIDERDFIDPSLTSLYRPDKAPPDVLKAAFDRVAPHLDESERALLEDDVFGTGLREQKARKVFSSTWPGAVTKEAIEGLHGSMDISMATMITRRIQQQADEIRDSGGDDDAVLAALGPIAELVDKLDPVIEEREGPEGIERIRGGIEDPKKAAKFIEELKANDQEVFDSQRGAIRLMMAGSGFTKTASFGALDPMEDLDSELHKGLLVRFQQDMDFKDKAIVEGSSLIPAVVNIGGLAKGFGTGMVKAGVPKAVAARTSGSAAMGIFAATQGAPVIPAMAFGFLAPATAGYAKNAMGKLAVKMGPRAVQSGLVARTQLAFAEGLGFLGAGVAIHGIPTLDEAAIDFLMGSVIGGASGRKRVLGQLKETHAKWAAAKTQKAKAELSAEYRRIYKENVKEFADRIRARNPDVQGREMTKMGVPEKGAGLDVRTEVSRQQQAGEPKRKMELGDVQADPARVASVKEGLGTAPKPLTAAAEAAPEFRHSIGGKPKRELRAEAKRLGVSQKGRKPEVLDRVVEAETKLAGERDAVRARFEEFSPKELRDLAASEGVDRRGGRDKIIERLLGNKSAFEATRQEVASRERQKRGVGTPATVTQAPSGRAIIIPAMPSIPLRNARGKPVQAPPIAPVVESKRQRPGAPAEDLDSALEAFSGGKPLPSEGTRLQSGAGGTGRLVAEALSVPRETVRTIFDTVQEKLWRAPIRGVGRAVSKLRKQDPSGGVSGSRKDAAAAIDGGSGDANRTASSFTAIKSDRAYSKDVTRLEVKDVIRTGAKFKDRRQTEQGQKYMEGELSFDQASAASGNPEMMVQLKRLRTMLDAGHSEGVRRGYVSETSDGTYGAGTHPDGGGRYIRRSYHAHLEQSLGMEVGSAIPRQRRKRDKFSVNYKDGNRTRTRNFHVLDHGGIAGAEAAAKAFAKVNKGRVSGKPPLDAKTREEMGEIRDPFYNAAVTHQLQEALASKHSFLSSIGGNSKLAFNSKREGRVVAPSGKVLNEGTLVPDGKLPKGFHSEPIPDLPQYGPLRGKFVRGKVRDEILSVFGNTGLYNQRWVRVLEGATSLWKQGKTIANPPTHVRNTVGNWAVFAELAPHGLSSLSPVDYGWLRKAHRVWASSSDTPAEFAMLKALTAGGVGRNQGRVKELLPYMGELEGTGAKTYSGAKGAVRKAADTAKTVYAYEDEIFKIAYALKQYGRLTKGKGGKTAKGRTRALQESIRLTNRYFPNYISNPAAAFLASKNNTSTLLRLSAAPPFMSFEFESARIMATHVAERPLSVGAGLWAMETAGSAMADMIGLDGDDIEQIRGSTPEWMQTGSPMTPILPFVSDDGQLTFLDGRYTYIGAEWYLAADRMLKGEEARAGTYAGILNNPIVSVSEDILRNRARFTQSPILPEGETPFTGMVEGDFTNLGQSLRYMAEQWLPPLAPGGRGLKRVLEGAGGDVKTSATGTTPRAEALRQKANFWVELHNNVLPVMFGARINQVDPRKSREARQMFLHFQVRELRQDIRKAMHNGQDKRVERLTRDLEKLAQESEKLDKSFSPRIKEALKK